MDDTKHYTVQLKGTAYRFKPIPADDLALVIYVINMNVSGAKLLKAVSKILAESAGPEQWDALTDRLISKELDVRELTVGLLERLMKRQGKDGTAPAEDAE